MLNFWVKVLLCSKCFLLSCFLPIQSADPLNDRHGHWAICFWASSRLWRSFGWRWHNNSDLCCGCQSLRASSWLISCIFAPLRQHPCCVWKTPWYLTNRTDPIHRGRKLRNLYRWTYGRCRVGYRGWRRWSHKSAQLGDLAFGKFRSLSLYIYALKDTSNKSEFPRILVVHLFLFHQVFYWKGELFLHSP